MVTRGQNGDAHVWDGTDGTHLRAIKAAWQRGLAMSPDGRYLVWPAADAGIAFTRPQSPGVRWEGTRIQLYDVAADRLEDRFPGFQGDAHDLAFLDDGKRLATVDHVDGVVRVWNAETGREERSFLAVPEVQKAQHNSVRRTMLSPDGKTLAVAYDQNETGGGGFRRFGPHLVRLWDVATGKERHVLDGHLHYVLDMAFSPDGRFLVTAGERASDANRMDSPARSVNQVFVWEVAGGTRVAALPEGLPIGAGAVAFSRDGLHLATAIPEGGIRLWEVATWTPVTEFPGHRDRATALTFSPDGRLLSGGVDTTVLAWTVRPPRDTAGPLEAAWVGLASRDGGEAFRAAGRFLGEPAAARFLAERIKPVPACDAARVRALIADLDSPDFRARQAASRGLAGHGDAVKLALQDCQTTTLPPEARRRVGEILNGFQTVTPEHLRRQRAVRVVGWVGGPEAEALLKAWAGGATGAALTERAAAMLERFAVAPPGRP